MAFSVDDLAILGLKITHGGIDLGVVTDFSFTPQVEKYPFYGTRTGPRQLLKEVVTQVRLEIGFSTSNVTDADVIALFTGGVGGAMTFEATDGALVVTRPNAETGGKQIVFNIPSASVNGTGMTGTEGTEEAKYTFQAVALLAEGETSIGTLTAAVPVP